MSKNFRFKGTGVAIVTPFNKDNNIDFKALGKLIDHIIKGGVEYVVALGTTGIWSIGSEVGVEVSKATLKEIYFEMKQLRDQNKKYDDLKVDIKGFSVDLIDADRQTMLSDTTKLNKEVKWTKNIQKDNYIFEASNILNDMK